MSQWLRDTIEFSVLKLCMQTFYMLPCRMVWYSSTQLRISLSKGGPSLEDGIQLIIWVIKTLRPIFPRLINWQWVGLIYMFLIWSSFFCSMMLILIVLAQLAWRDLLHYAVRRQSKPVYLGTWISVFFLLIALWGPHILFSQPAKVQEELCKLKWPRIDGPVTWRNCNGNR